MADVSPRRDTSEDEVIATTSPPSAGLPVVGYAEPWSVAPGEQVRFRVSCELSAYEAEVVRLIHGDDRPGAPGVKEVLVETSVGGTYAGRAQPYPTGSCVVVPDHEGLRVDDSFTLAAWICPTLPAKNPQGLLTKWSGGAEVGYAMVIDDRGELGLWLGAPGRESQRVSSGAPLRPGQWYFVAVSFNVATGSALLIQSPTPPWPLDDTAVVVEHFVDSTAVQDSDGPFLMGAWSAGGQDDTGRAGHYNGKLEAPVLFAAALDRTVLDALAAGAAVVDAGPVCAAWDFALDTMTDRVRDVSGNSLDGRAVNLPARAMSGHAFAGGERAWPIAPETHGALQFHDDDLEDCVWDVDFDLTIPETLRSGVYAAKLTAGGSTYHVPFFVRPTGRRAAAPILLLMPTNSYLAYANFREDFAESKKVLGLYHSHEDGSAVFYSSGLRPIVNMRPGANFNILDESGAPHQFNADLYLVDWLTAKGFEFDVATDEDLDREGVGLLEQYRTVLTGSHPEYWTGRMLDELQTYLGNGGRVMYLGGNGFIWVTSFDPARRHVVEVRRGAGGGVRSATPGERYHSTTGEFGGPWRERGRPPNRIVGVGSIAQGFDRSSGYKRQPDSFDPRAEWIFDGVEGDEQIGGFGLTMGGAAGFEIDCADGSLGTPPHTLVVASATEFSSTYEHQHPQHVAGTTLDLHDPMRCDMVFFETPEGGAVFSVGSISYCGSLSHNSYDNNVSRITENVLRRFSAQ